MSGQPSLPSPSRAGVLVLGAGPAGSACALRLARAGIDVALVDRKEFPREKVCGDALLADALDALDALGVLDRVLARARAAGEFRISSPGGHDATLRGRVAVLPRLVLDAILVEACRDAGARFVAPVRAVAPIPSAGRIRGAMLAGPAGPATAFEAGATVLATGSAPEPLRSFGGRLPAGPDAVAARAYVELPPGSPALDVLHVAYDRTICPAYGWIFPAPGRIVNVGVGRVREGRPGTPEANVRALWTAFVESYPPAREILRGGRQVSALRGAPLRTGFGGGPPTRPGLLVVGEAAGLTHPFTGEGIGNALRSGILAAEALLEEDRKPSPDAGRLSSRFAETLDREFGTQLRAFRRAQGWASVPWTCDLMCRRASRPGWVRTEMEGILGRGADPRRLFSSLGFVRVLLG